MVKAMAAQVVPLQSRPLREKAKASNQARNLRLKVKGHLGWRKKMAEGFLCNLAWDMLSFRDNDFQGGLGDFWSWK